MKTVADTPDTLILEDRPFALGAAIIIVAALIVALGVIVLAWGIDSRSKDLILPPGVTLIGGGLFMGACALWGAARHVQLWLDRPAGRAALRHRHIFGFRERRLALADLVRCEVRSITRKGQRLTRPVLIFGGETAQDVPVVPGYHGGDWADDVAHTINTWLSRRA